MRSWFKLDDGMPEHPKIVALNPGAAWTYVCGIAYSSRAMTDGFLPEPIARRLTPRDSADELVEAGLWIVVKGGFRIHDYLDYQRSKADILQLREERKAAGAKGGKVSKRAKDKRLLGVGLNIVEAELEEEQREVLKNPPVVPPSRKPNVVWDFVVELKGEPLPRQRAAYGRIVSDLDTLLSASLNGASDDERLSELHRRYRRLAEEWGEGKATVRSLVENWALAGRLAGEYRPGVESPEQLRARMQRKEGHA